MCTPGMSQIPSLSGGVNLWGESPLYVNPVNISKSISQRQVVDPVIGGHCREAAFEGKGRAVYEPKGEGIL